jgi:hypothetical protein
MRFGSPSPTLSRTLGGPAITHFRDRRVTGTVDGTRDSSPPINREGARNTRRVVAGVWNLPVLR